MLENIKYILKVKGHIGILLRNLEVKMLGVWRIRMYMEGDEKGRLRVGFYWDIRKGHYRTRDRYSSLSLIKQEI